MTALSEQDQRIIAAADLVGRTGARHFDIGYLDDDVPAHLARWWASAAYKGGRIMATDHRTPAEAAEALAVKILTGARCACGKLVALTDIGAVAFNDPVMTDGSKFPITEALSAGQCLWKREGQRWVSGCGQRGRPL